MFDWFKPKNKKNVVLPNKELGQLQGVELIQAFSTDDEPKLCNFPKTKYNAYWEILLAPVPGGYQSVVRFYKYNTGLAKELTFTNESLNGLRKEVSDAIQQHMDIYKRPE